MTTLEQRPDPFDSVRVKMLRTPIFLSMANRLVVRVTVRDPECCLSHCHDHRGFVGELGIDELMINSPVVVFSRQKSSERRRYAEVRRAQSFLG